MVQFCTCISVTPCIYIYIYTENIYFYLRKNLNQLNIKCQWYPNESKKTTYLEKSTIYVCRYIVNIQFNIRIYIHICRVDVYMQ